MMRNNAFNLPLFTGFSELELNQLEPLMEFCLLKKDMVIFEQGAKAEYFYILTSGKVMIRYKPYDAPELTIANILPGNVFGWSAALNRLTYSSAAITQADSEAMRIRREDIQCLCQKFPKTGAIFINRLAGSISERIQNSHQDILTMLSSTMDSSSECWRRINQYGNKERIHA